MITDKEIDDAPIEYVTEHTTIEVDSKVYREMKKRLTQVADEAARKAIVQWIDGHPKKATR